MIAPQEFKGSLSALEIAQAMANGARRVLPKAELVIVPVADGGDGTLQSLVDSSRGRVVTTRVQDPLGRPVDADWGSLGDGNTAVIEMARSSGLALLDVDQLDPLSTTTYGVGELIRAALDAGHRKMIVGIGGSATNDGGAGMAQALGFRLLDEHGANIKPGGAALSDLHSIDTTHADHRLQETDVIVACDVNNPLTGPTGASVIFGPQKGASPDMVKELDIALAHFANVVEQDLGVDIRHRAGAGAAGGLGGGLTAFVNADMRAGVDIVLEAVGLGERLDGADLVITGEGQFDRSTIFNKAPVGVAKLAKERGVPVIGIAGALAEGFSEVHDHGIDAVFTLVNGPTTLEKAIESTRALVASTTEEVLRAMLA